MRKEIPREASFEALFAPKPEYRYLEEAERFPFTGSRDYSSVDAWWLAELSLLAYLPDEARIADVLAAAGLAEPVFFAREGTFGFVSGELCVFRGTDEVRDFLRDLDTALVPDGDVKVHRGFQRALDCVWDELAGLLEGRAVCFTGHSLGGALATLAAWRQGEVARAYTFGAPRVGERLLHERLRAPVHRVVNNNDLVTRLPPPLGYRHAGTLHYIDESGRVHDRPERWSRVVEQVLGHGNRAMDNVRRWLSGEFDAIPYDSLVDHSPVHYAVHLWNELVATA